MMRPAFAGVLGVAALAAACGTYAQIAPGEYVFERGRGVLKVLPASGGAQKFHINTVGGNFHICELAGVMRNNEARMDESDQKNLPCIVTFKAEKQGVAVAPKHERTCSTYCGVRAHFEGFYTLPPPACEPSRVRRVRDQFKAAYDRKQYNDALTLLKPVLELCGSLLNDYDEGWVRNDLAITYFRVGNPNACHETLLRWVDLARQPDSQIKEGYPPSDAEEMLRLAQATRYNMKLCGAPIPARAKP